MWIVAWHFVKGSLGMVINWFSRHLKVVIVLLVFLLGTAIFWLIKTSSQLSDTEKERDQIAIRLDSTEKVSNLYKGQIQSVKKRYTKDSISHEAQLDTIRKKISAMSLPDKQRANLSVLTRRGYLKK